MFTQQGTPDLTFVRLIHQALRIDGARLVTTVDALRPEDRTDRVPRVRAFYDKYREELVAHHTHEDTLYYPRWRPESRMVDGLTRHLDFEERTALPLFESDMPVSEHKELEKKVRKMMRRGQARFLIPWLATHATPEQRRTWFKSAPPLRVVAWVNGRSYRRIDEVLLAA